MQFVAHCARLEKICVNQGVKYTYVNPKSSLFEEVKQIDSVWLFRMIEANVKYSISLRNVS